MSLFCQFNLLVPFLTFLAIFPLASLCQVTPQPPYLVQKESSIPRILILDVGHSETATLSIALQTLGYSWSASPNIAYSQKPVQDNGSDSRIYSILFSPISYQYIALSHPETKFILPVREKCKAGMQTRGSFGQTWLGIRTRRRGLDSQHACGSREYIDSVQQYFESEEMQGRLLVIATDESQTGGAGAKWEEVCGFLQLGYSVVERLRLRTFPGNGRGRLSLDLKGWTGEV